MWRKALVVVLVGLSAGGLAWAEEWRTGAWVDQVIFLEEPYDFQAVSRIEAYDGDLYAEPIADSELYRKIDKSRELTYRYLAGNLVELTFNPVLKFQDGRLNPFGNPKIREAMNWLIDREYIQTEIYKWRAVAQYTALPRDSLDYIRLVDVARALEVKYAYNPEKAKEVIFAEMKKLGAKLLDGKWTYNWNPVGITFLIRTDKDELRDIGDYVASSLEELGFTVYRKYGNLRELTPFWLYSNPAEGKWNLYIGRWPPTHWIYSDAADIFDVFYTPRGSPYQLWHAYEPSWEFDEISRKLAQRDFTTIKERNELMAKALELSMEDSVRVWIVNEASILAIRKGLDVVHDLLEGLYGSWIWAQTLRWVDPETGEIKPGGTVEILTPYVLYEPWNAVAGSSWTYDLMPIRATADTPVVPNPFIGLALPNRVEKAEVYVLKGLPVTKNEDWVDLKFVDEIKVPADAYIDWDAYYQKWITVGEKYPEGLTAKTKTVVYFADDMFKMKWHDGSTMDPADVFLPIILGFDRANPNSPIYDESTVPGHEAFREIFKGFRIDSIDPLVVEYYSDSVYLDAEYIAADAATSFDAYYGYGAAPWDAIAIGILAEADKKLAFSSDKADKLGAEWMNYVAGPSLDILAEELDKAIEEWFVPYEWALEQMGVEISADEVAARYNALKRWYEEKGHFWVGNGPFYLDEVDPVAGIIVLNRFPEFPDPADKWFGFAEPLIPTVKFGNYFEPVVKIGERAVITVNITSNGHPYPEDEIDSVKYLVFDSEGNLLLKGDVWCDLWHTWEVVLKAKDTAKFPAGPIKVEVVVIPKLLRILTIKDIELIALP